MVKLAFTFSLLLTGHCLLAQEYPVSGHIKDDAGAPVAQATVSLLKATDSSWVQTELTDDNGAYELKPVASGQYLLDVQVLGYTNKKFELTVTDKAVAFEAVIAKQSNTLQGVMVKATKPFIEMGPGKMVVNVSGTVAGAGTSAYDLLKKSPGVSIDQNGNISLKGKQGIMVLIDERQTYLSGAALTEYLKSIPSDDIAQLELITQPTSRFDAEGNGGIINIVQKKNKKEGFNGNVSYTWGHGVYPFTRGNGNLTWKKNRLNVYTNVSGNASYGFLRGTGVRNLYDGEGTLLSTTHGDLFMKELFSDCFIRTGADYNFSDKTTAGVLASYNYHPNTEEDVSQQVVNDYANNRTIYNEAKRETGFLRNRVMANAYLKNQLTEKQKIITNADYTYSLSDNRMLTINTDKDENGDVIPGALTLRNKIPYRIDAVSIKSDYTGELSKTLKVEAGVKAAYTRTDNNAMYDICIDGEWMNDTLRTNHFIYKENINAAYVSVNKEYGEKWKLQGGLRAEQSNISGDQETNGAYFERSNLYIFPTLFASCALDKKNEVQLNYGKRINRPRYGYLNPFPQYITQYDYMIGNPTLKPEITHNLELSHVYNGELTTTVSYSKDQDVINGVNYPTSIPNVTYGTNENIAECNTGSLSVTMAKQLLTWWNLTVMGYGFYSDFYDSRAASHRYATGWGFDVDSQFTFKDGWKAECHINFMGRVPEGMYGHQGPAVYSTCGVSKNILKDTGTLRLNIEDPFHAYRNRWEASNQYVQSSGITKFNTFAVGLTFTYGFGRETGIKQRDRVSDESKRM